MRRSIRYLAAPLLAALISSCSGPESAVPTAPAAPTIAPLPTVDAHLATTAPPNSEAPGKPIDTVAAQPATSLPANGEAPGKPIDLDVWSPGNKQGVGTAFTYDQPAGDANPSRVWFGITGGAITEGEYPNVSRANVKSLGVLVTDGKSFLADETVDATYKVERLDGRTPAFRVTSIDKNGRWAVTKEIVTDPQANAILFTIAFQALQGQPEDYHVYLNYIPRIGQSGAGDLSAIENGVAEAWDEQAGVFSALATDPPPVLLTSGYTRKNDLATDLKDYKVDATYSSTRQPGRLSIGAELDISGATTIALGFGRRRDEARAAANASLKRGFADVSAAYMRGWAGYLDQLVHPYPKLPLYDESLAVLKTHEDKTNYGAFVASLAIPWGHKTTDENPRARGYRYVWARDMYHTVTALRLAGDQQSARDTLAFMDDKLQQLDGGFPQTAFPDGTPNTTGVQLDQTATPILLAWQLKAIDRYTSLVKPAADYLLKIGPKTQQERWEEIGGYSPATLAAEIAALVCAADLATQAGDSASATQYLKIADEWNANIEKWTLTTNGPLGKGTYYLRISDGDPNSAEPIAIANNGGAHDRREIVDQSFLELVRLGLRKPNDPNILATLDVIDATIEVKTPKGEVYYRYPHDGYGESKLGDAPDGHGSPWPLLIGERSIYEVAFSRAEHPASWYLPVMSSMANQGGMLPEQVFLDGTGTGSATPLAWAHAEYVVFSLAVKQAQVPDMPAVVAERYAK
jgi:glucoamylase